MGNDFDKYGSGRYSRAAILLVSMAAGSVFAQVGLPDTTADAVYGQGGFTNITANRGQTNPSENTLNGPFGAVADSVGGLYVSDSNNNRVLYYPSGSQTPNRVYGQADSLQTATANKGGVSRSSLRTPIGLAVDSANGLYVADFANNRVLYYPAGSTTADRVYGQGGSFTTVAANLGATAPSRTSLASPIAVTVDSANGLYVVDFANNRVLHYPNGSTIADRVYGQGGNFTVGTPNTGGISATSLRTPEGVNVDGNDGLYIVDRDNNRVLHYPSGGTVADKVYGQGNSFISGTINLGGVSNESLAAPIQMVADPAGGLFITDFSNNRVLHYPAVSIGIADRVYGQSNAFNTNVANKGGNPASADSLLSPFGVALDSLGTLYIADLGNNRVLRFDPPPPAVPTIQSVTTTPSAVVAGTQFTFAISGANFNVATVLAEFTGPNCSPCRVSNAQFTAKSATSVTGTITLATAGNYSVTVRNGAANPVSAGFALTVTAATTAPLSCGCDLNGDSRVDISDVISLVRLVQGTTPTPTCRAGIPFTIADVIHVVTVVLGSATCRL